MSEHCNFPNNTKQKFSIVLKSTCASGIFPCSRQLIVKLENAVITLGSKADGASFLPTLVVDNGNLKNYYSKDVDVEFVGGKHTVQVHAAVGFVLTWTGYNAYLTVEPSLEDQTCGLCGTFNHQASDDFKKRGGDVEPSANAFAKDWISSKASADCHGGDDWSKIMYANPCNFYTDNKVYAQNGCNHIKDKDGIFKHCHRFIPSTEYYKKCLEDGCRCKSCLCNTASAYARACAEKGIVIKGWRSAIPDCSSRKCSY